MHEWVHLISEPGYPHLIFVLKETEDFSWSSLKKDTIGIVTTFSILIIVRVCVDVVLLYRLTLFVFSCCQSSTTDDKIEPSVRKVDYRDAFGDIDSDDESEYHDALDDDDDDEEEEEEEEFDEANCEGDEKEDGNLEKCDEMEESGDVDTNIEDDCDILEKVADEPKCQAMEVSDNDDCDWITADNLADHDFSEDFQAFKSTDESTDEPESDPVVSCLTTDFAMQNVLLSMGLPVRSVEGMIVKSPKSFALWCFACNK